MTKDDAKMFPIIASASLFGLYIAFKYFNENVVKELIFIYLIIVSALALASCMNMYLENRFPSEVYHLSLTWRTICDMDIDSHRYSFQAFCSHPCL